MGVNRPAQTHTPSSLKQNIRRVIVDLKHLSSSRQHFSGNPQVKRENLASQIKGSIPEHETPQQKKNFRTPTILLATQEKWASRIHMAKL
jgi:hypothetical protein